MTKEKKSAILHFLIFVFYTYQLINREKYPLLENVKAVYKYYYIPCIWGLFVTGFVLFMTFKKEKSDFMKKLDEKSRSIIFILTLVLGNDYIFFLSVKMSQANGILNPLEPLELLISYIIIIITAIASLVMIYKILKE